MQNDHVWWKFREQITEFCAVFLNSRRIRRGGGGGSHAIKRYAIKCVAAKKMHCSKTCCWISIGYGNQHNIAGKGGGLAYDWSSTQLWKEDGRLKWYVTPLICHPLHWIAWLCIPTVCIGWYSNRRLECFFFQVASNNGSWGFPKRGNITSICMKTFETDWSIVGQKVQTCIESKLGDLLERGKKSPSSRCQVDFDVEIKDIVYLGAAN